jgi:hypothetical protein
MWGTCMETSRPSIQVYKEKLIQQGRKEAMKEQIMGKLTKRSEAKTPAWWS